ncbi:hypothetical protein ACFZCF_14145 [Streptomyces sp. NPDC007945]|uniref:hypothetical protein n=1 Tax=Streptomyces sp. NPDC007945 TaxID=3364797 RepID=UPI0036E51FE7
MPLAGLAPVARAVELPLAPRHRLVDSPAQHPHLAPNGRSGMHADGADNGTHHPYPGPLERSPEMHSERIVPSAANLFPSGVRDPRHLPSCGTRAGASGWVTRLGRVGTVDPATGRLRAIRREDGGSVVTGLALYAFRADGDGTARVVWREAYDRGRAPSRVR